MWDYSYNPKIMAMSIISVFALAYPMPPISYILYCPCRGVAAPAPPVSRLKARLYGV